MLIGKLTEFLKLEISHVNITHVALQRFQSIASGLGTQYAMLTPVTVVGVGKFRF
jgi:hypothetical protein